MTKKALFKVGENNYVPEEANQRYGCLHCDWRRTMDCPTYDPKTMNFVQPEKGICSKRLTWLATMTPPYKTSPEYSTWLLDFRKGVGDEMLSKFRKIMDMFESKLESLERQGVSDEKVARQISLSWKQFNQAKNDWLNLYKTLLHFDDQQVNRDTPKRQEIVVTKRTTLDDLQRIQRGDVVEVEDD